MYSRDGGQDQRGLGHHLHQSEWFQGRGCSSSCSCGRRQESRVLVSSILVWLAPHPVSQSGSCLEGPVTLILPHLPLRASQR